MKSSILFILAIAAIVPLIAQNLPPAQAEREAAYINSGQWANYGNDPGGMRYSPLEEINTANVGRLEPAWTFRTGELETYEGTEVGRKAAFEATPIMLDGVLYFSTPTNRVFAINAASGEEVWRYEPGTDLSQDYSEITSRGVSKWIDAERKPGDEGYLRIIAATIDGRLIALDAKDGKPVASFGNKGTVDLRKGLGSIQVTSPPAVIGNLIITGSTMGDNQRLDYPRGVVRAFDAKSGRLMWSWDPIPRNASDPMFETWSGPKVQKTGGANAWAPLSCDPDLGLVFVPTSCPSPDYYGGERKGDNRYANSVVALKAETGEVAWHFQTVHHDIWDYDLAAQPLLSNLEVDGESVPAVVVVTKMGHIFALDRRTGDPIFPVEERSVPPSDVPGEATSATQPFPAQLPVFGLREVTSGDAWGPTEAHRQRAQNRIDSLLFKGVFTPPGFQGSIVTPSNVGGMNWSGACFDPERKLLFTNTNRLAAVITLYRRNTDDPGSINQKQPRAEIGRQVGTPYLMSRDYLLSVTPEEGLIMQTKPPWGTLAAVDMVAGSLAWEVPLGYMMDPEKYPEAGSWGSLNLGGAICTQGGLVFIAAALDGIFRAFDAETGKVLWQAKLPAPGQATPMTYRAEGRQYVVIAAGGHARLDTSLGDYLVAYALPE